MIRALLIVVVALVVGGALLRGYAWWLRRQGLARLAGVGLDKEARGVNLRVQIRGTAVLPGMRGGANRTVGDFALAAERFVLASGRGVLADVKLGRGRGFTSVRCTGPNRLVIEGTVPRPQGRPGLYRIEAMVDEAQDWAQRLAPYVTESADGPEYGTL